MSTLRTSAAALSVLLIAPHAHALWEDEDGALTLDGSFRNMSALVDYYDSPLFGPSSAGADFNQADGLSYSSLRLTADGRPADWFSYDVHLVQDAMLTTSPGASSGLEFAAGQTTRYRLLGFDHAWVEDGDVTSHLFLDRAVVKYQLPGFNLALGRQAVTFGKAQFWNPLDVFLPFDSRQFDREYKRGVDAARLDVPLGDMSGLTVVTAVGRADGARVTSRSWYGSAVLGRAYTNVADWDLAAQGGQIYGGYQAGGALAGVVGPIEVRAEGAYFFARHSDQELTPVDDHFVGAIGVGRLFDCSLNLQAEYLFNGAGDDDDLPTSLLRVTSGRALQMSEHLAGAMMSYDLTALLTGSVATIVSLSDASGVVQPGLSYSVADESDVLAGALIAWGKRPSGTTLFDTELRSEFGTYPNFYYVQYRFYF